MAKIIPIRDLRNIAKISELCHKDLEPVFVTKNGYSDLVIMSNDTFELLVSTNQIFNDPNRFIPRHKRQETVDALASIKDALSR